MHCKYPDKYKDKYKEDKMIQSGLFNELKIYIDGGLNQKFDGLVDVIQFGFPSRKILNRTQDYNFHKEDFNKADEDLKNLKKEFKKYIKK